MIDTRPVTYCPRCRRPVVPLPSMRCPWCDQRIPLPLDIPATFHRIDHNHD